ncbi:MAG TPA: hypothetical protein VGM62_15660 [Chthoniobacterales bacterium]
MRSQRRSDDDQFDAFSRRYKEDFDLDLDYREENWYRHVNVSIYRDEEDNHQGLAFTIRVAIQEGFRRIDAGFAFTH